MEEIKQSLQVPKRQGQRRKENIAAAVDHGVTAVEALDVSGEGTIVAIEAGIEKGDMADIMVMANETEIVTTTGAIAIALALMIGNTAEDDTTRDPEARVGGTTGTGLDEENGATLQHTAGVTLSAGETEMTETIVTADIDLQLRCKQAMSC